jgi:hypothetical protein
MFLGSSVLRWQATLERHLAVGPLLWVSAVVVNPILGLHPLHLPQLSVGKPTVPAAEAGGTAGDAPPAVALADVEVDAVVVGDEGCLGPVGLDEAALRRPVLRRPDAGVGVHGLPRRELGTTLVVVAEHADGGAVDVPPTYHPMDTQQHKLSSDHFLLPVLCSH